MCGSLKYFGGRTSWSSWIPLYGIHECLMYFSPNTCLTWGRMFSPTSRTSRESCNRKSSGVFIFPCCILRFYMKSMEIILLSQRGNSVGSEPVAFLCSYSVKNRTMNLEHALFEYAESSHEGFILAIGFNPRYLCFDKHFVNVINHYHLSDNSWCQSLLRCVCPV